MNVEWFLHAKNTNSRKQKKQKNKQLWETECCCSTPLSTQDGTGNTRVLSWAWAPVWSSSLPPGYYSKYRHYLHPGFHSPSPQNNNSWIKMKDWLFEIKISSWEWSFPVFLISNKRHEFKCEPRWLWPSLRAGRQNSLNCTNLEET